MNARDIEMNLADESIYEIYDQAANHFKDGSVFVELGCFVGASTCYLAQKIQEQKKDIVIYAVDRWRNMVAPGRDYSKPTVPGSNFPEFWQNIWDCGIEQYIKPVNLDSSYTARVFEDKSVDFLYIDADHSYKKFKEDVLCWLPKMKDESWIGGHDYNQEVEKVVHEIFGEKAEGYYGDGKISKNCNSWLVKGNIFKTEKTEDSLILIRGI